MGTAAEFIREGLTACLPPGVPLMGEIVAARFTGKGKVEADLILFDGERATVEVSKFGPFRGWHKRWVSLSTDIHWNGSEWERVAVTLCQLTFNLEGAPP